MSSDASISVLVPVYNSEESLPELVRRLAETLSKCASEFEIVLVNDGSRDSSWEVIRELAASNSCVRGLDMMRNYGQHNALLAAIRLARNELIVTIDDDLQHPPEEIPKLLDKMAEGFDVVYGTPEREQHGLLRDLASQMTKLGLQSVIGVKTARKVSAFRVFRTRLRKAFEDYRNPYVSIDVLLTWGTAKFAAVPVRHEPRLVGTSNYTLSRLMVHALNMVTGFSTWPLRLASWTGFAFTGFGILVLIYVIGRFILQGTSVPGFVFLASIISIFSGAQLFALGIIGEYIARMHFRMLERPPYTIGESTQDLSEVISVQASEE